VAAISDDDVAAFVAELATQAQTDPAAAQILADLQAATPENQADFVGFVTGEIELAPGDIVTVAAGESTQVRAGEASTHGIQPLAAHLATNTVSFTYPVEAFGITFGSYHSEYTYVWNYVSSKVVADQSCTAWHSGSAGFTSYSVDSINRWVSSGQGHCTAIFKGTIAVLGYSVDVDKRMKIKVISPHNYSGLFEAI
jgi:hypothetical protein